MALWDNEVGEMADSGFYSLEQQLQFTVSRCILACLSSSWCPAISLG